MKYILLLLVLLSCREKQPKWGNSESHYRDVVIVGSDTIEYFGEGRNADFTRAHSRGHGQWDTVSNIFNDTAWIKPFETPVYIHDTIYKWKRYIPKGYYHYSILDVDTAEWEGGITTITVDTTDNMGESEIEFHFPDSTITIKGDTTKALWIMYKYYMELKNKQP